MIGIRPTTPDDAARFTALYGANRAFLAPWEPVRDETFFTEEGQRDRLRRAADDARAGTGYGCAIEVDGEIVGSIALSAIARGPAQSANLGYWVAQAVNGKGYASGAVALMLDVAFGELGLHRVQAATLLHNAGSQRVLERAGFTRIGVAPSYLHIAGAWQDHILFQRVAGA